MNTYAYVGGNPLIYYDPLGLFQVSPEVKTAIETLRHGTRAVATTDAATPDPSDAAWPKWAAYATVAGVAAGIGALCETEEDE